MVHLDIGTHRLRVATDGADAVLDVIPEGGHWLHQEAPDAVVAAVARVL